MKKRSKARRSKNRKLDFQRLEPRQLLAGDLVGPHQVSLSIPQDTNLIVNGDFETVSNADDNFYAQDDVADWEGKSATQELNIFNYEGYGNVLDLDSTEREFDRVFQSVDTVAGKEYLITFDFRTHPVAFASGADANTNSFRVLWNGSVVGDYSAADLWQTGAIKVTGTGGSAELLFCEIEEGALNAGDSRGPLLDNIRMVETTDAAIVNGGFETTEADKSLFFRPWEVDGWAAMGADVNDRFLKVINNSQSNNQGTEGDQYLNLDTRADFTDIIYQNVTTEAGKTYFVSFDYRTDGIQGDDVTQRDEVRVQWNDVWATTLIGDGEWRTVGMYLTATSDMTRLTFREPGTANGGDGSGALIDNVKMFEVLEAQQNSGEISIDLNPDSGETQGTATYLPGVGSQTVASNLTIAHTGSGNLTSATVTLDGRVDGGDEIIGVVTGLIPTNGSGDPLITVSDYDSSTGQLVLTGETTVENYQNVLRSLSYFNAAGSPTVSNRSVTISLTDSSLTDGTSSEVVDISIETNQATIDDAIVSKFIADNNLDAFEVSNGLYMQIDEPGSGLNPSINDTIQIAYAGKFLELNDQNQMVEGVTFEATGDEGTTLRLSQVIAGWRIGVPELKSGGSGKLIIPSRLAYGANGQGQIPGNTVLIFDIDLLQILT